MLEEPLVKEVIEAIKVLKNSKSPGTDGIPGEVYKQYVIKLTPMLLDLYNEVLQYGKMNKSARGGILTLLEKIKVPHLYSDKV